MKSPKKVRHYTIHWRDGSGQPQTRKMRWVDVLAPEFTRRFRRFCELLRMQQVMAELYDHGCAEIFAEGETCYADGEIDAEQEYAQLCAIVRQGLPEFSDPNPPPRNDRGCKPH